MYIIDAVGSRTIEFNGANRVFQIGVTYLLPKRDLKSQSLKNKIFYNWIYTIIFVKDFKQNLLLT